MACIETSRASARPAAPARTGNAERLTAAAELDREPYAEEHQGRRMNMKSVRTRPRHPTPAVHRMKPPVFASARSCWFDSSQPHGTEKTGGWRIADHPYSFEISPARG